MLNSRLAAILLDLHFVSLCLVQRHLPLLKNHLAPTTYSYFKSAYAVCDAQFEHTMHIFFVDGISKVSKLWKKRNKVWLYRQKIMHTHIGLKNTANNYNTIRTSEYTMHVFDYFLFLLFFYLFTLYNFILTNGIRAAGSWYGSDHTS